MGPLQISIMLAAIVGLLIYALFVPKSDNEFKLSNADDPDRTRFMKFLGVTTAEIYSALPSSLANKIDNGKQTNIELLFQKSGNPWNLKPKEFAMVRIGTGVIGFVAGLAVWFLLKDKLPLSVPVFVWIGVGTLLGYMSPRTQYASAANKRDVDFKRQLPDALDLLIISLSSGTTFGHALRESVPNMTAGVLKEEFAEISRKIDLGQTLHEALDGFAEKSPSESISAFIRAVQEATALNVPIVEVLQSRADASRREYFAMLQQKTASLESKLMAVLTPTLIPALLIVAIAPAGATLMSSMG